MATITAHCLVKNEENFVWYAIKSVIDFVDKIIVFDTGSTDKTVEIVQGLAKEYPDKIFFEEKGECDKKRHTELRQEMVDKTATDWFMILDGDEVWTRRGMEEVLNIINENSGMECLIAPFYLCVGDVYHYSRKGLYEIMGQKGHFSPKLFKKTGGFHWGGDYGEGDFPKNSRNKIFYNSANSIFLRNKFWHTSCLPRSSGDNLIKLGRHKVVNTFSLKLFGTGFKIKDDLPEVFKEQSGKSVQRMSVPESLINLIKYLINKCLNYFS